MKKIKHIFLASISIALIVVASILLLSHTTDVEQKQPYSPFPLTPVPHLSNEISNRPEFEKLDKEVRNFMKQWQINGASLAIAKNGKLLYVKGFGYANVEQKKRVEPYHIFRVASVSKLVTATAIMKLIEDGKLDIDARIFGANGILNDSIFSEIRDKRTLHITVKNLLEHSAGWTASRYGDPMFMNAAIAREQQIPLPICMNDIIRFVLSKHMHYSTGAYSSYSNVGYAILGSVIEKITGMAYEDYVRETLLTPMGISDMRIGNSYPQDLYRDEVSYYDVWDAEPVAAFDNTNLQVLKCNGGYDIRTLAAAGGWVASSVDLVRFMLCIDGDSVVPDILSRESIDKMVHNDSGFDPLGWRAVNARYWLRTGTLAGTAAVAVRDTGGLCWAFITNTSSWKGSTFPLRINSDIGRLLATEVPKWNDSYNLFDEKISPSLIKPITTQDVHLRP